MYSGSFSSPAFLLSIKSQDGYHLNHECGKGGKYATLEIDECKIYSVPLGNGFLSSLGSVFSFPQILSDWVQIKTKNVSYFILVRRGADICLFPCRNEYHAKILGHSAASFDYYDDSKIITLQKHWTPLFKCTLDDVYHWSTKQDSNYNLINNNNSKQLSLKFYQESTYYDLGKRSED